MGQRWAEAGRWSEHARGELVGVWGGAGRQGRAPGRASLRLACCQAHRRRCSSSPCMCGSAQPPSYSRRSCLGCTGKPRLAAKAGLDVCRRTHRRVPPYAALYRSQGSKVSCLVVYPNSRSTEIRVRLNLRSTHPGANNRLDIESIVSFDREANRGTSLGPPQGEADGITDDGAYASAPGRLGRDGC